ncbi:hypothetical protein CIRG_00040 [Coccidioides immitis RMSCC 2394]|uniref:Uncharacterized protein n=1 Tax=Coccidioides immitis RMSCC 2394 TaxID=404692 RepID=A0A0J6Y026_COCIT|nr:hypothetical protein CIRG_00040 [Coccidioides immitis RMSCC 2394]
MYTETGGDLNPRPGCEVETCVNTNKHAFRCERGLSVRPWTGSVDSPSFLQGPYFGRIWGGEERVVLVDNALTKLTSEVGEQQVTKQQQPESGASEDKQRKTQKARPIRARGIQGARARLVTLSYHHVTHVACPVRSGFAGDGEVGCSAGEGERWDERMRVRRG